MKILEVKDLSVKYNEHYALKNISFDINEKEYVCLVGKNGSGKSTLLKTISGLIKKETGNVEFKINRSEVSYLAQNNMTDIDFPATAKEIILTGVQKHGIKPFYSKEDEKALGEVAKKLKIEDRWILNKLDHMIQTVTRNIEEYDLGIALDNIYSFIWNEFLPI